MSLKKILRNVGKVMTGIVLLLWLLLAVGEAANFVLTTYLIPPLLLGLLWLGVAFMVSWVARQRGRDGWNWFWLGLFFSFIPLIALVAVPSVEDEDKMAG